MGRKSQYPKEDKEYAKKLYERYGYSYHAIGARLSIPPNTVQSWSYRGKWKKKRIIPAIEEIHIDFLDAYAQQGLQAVNNPNDSQLILNASHTARIVKSQYEMIQVLPYMKLIQAYNMVINHLSDQEIAEITLDKMEDQIEKLKAELKSVRNPS